MSLKYDAVMAGAVFVEVFYVLSSVWLHQVPSSSSVLLSSLELSDTQVYEP